MDTEQLKNLHKVELSILKELDTACKKLGIQYFVWYGTAIGAVRHKGFIPWDDDIDVVMLRKDFMRFIKEAPSILPEHLFLQYRDSDPNYYILHAKLKDNNTTFLEPGYEKNKGHQGIFIDIFPLDYLPASPLKRRIQAIKKKILQNLIVISPDTNYWRLRGVKHKIYAILQPLLRIFVRDRMKLVRRLDSILTDVSPSPYIVEHQVKRSIYKTKWIREVTRMPFEDFEVPLPSCFHEILTANYGDYMQLPPVEDQKPRHISGIIDTERPYTSYIQFSDMKKSHINQSKTDNLLDSSSHLKIH